MRSHNGFMANSGMRRKSSRDNVPQSVRSNDVKREYNRSIWLGVTENEWKNMKFIRTSLNFNIFNRIETKTSKRDTKFTTRTREMSCLKCKINQKMRYLHPVSSWICAISSWRRSKDDLFPIVSKFEYQKYTKSMKNVSQSPRENYD